MASCSGGSTDSWRLPQASEEGTGNESADSGNDSDDQSTPPSKRKRYSCVFRKNLTKVFPWATDSKRGRSYAFCMRCSRDISMAHGGVKDLRRHEHTALHSRAEQSIVGAMPLSSYFGSDRGRTAVIEAEVKFGYFIGEHHLAFNLADHASKLFPSMFPDSAVAKEFKCSRTKATAILKVIAQDAWRSIERALGESKYFSLQTDETTDISVTQQMAIMLRFFDNSLGVVRCVFFKLEGVERATAEQLYLLIDKHFQTSDTLKYDYLVGLGTDGANVMLGKRNSVMSRLCINQPGLVALHCNCHIAALIAKASCTILPDYLEELTSDVWYYFQKSSKRLRIFEHFQCFVNVKPHKLLKACQTMK